jgi:hypothetical protein
VAWPKCWLTLPPPSVATATSTVSSRPGAAVRRLQRRLLGGVLGLALKLDLFLVGGGVCVDLVERELVAAILAQQADRIGAALAAVAHHRHVAGAGILQVLQHSSGVGPAGHEAVVGAVLGSAISGMTLCRKAPLALTIFETSFRCSSLTPGISTELTLVQDAARRSASPDPAAAARCRMRAPSMPVMRLFSRRSTGRSWRRLPGRPVDGDRHVVDVVLAISVDVLGRLRPLVDTHSLMSGARSDSCEGFEGAARVGQGSPGPAMPSTVICGISLATASTFLIA